MSSDKKYSKGSKGAQKLEKGVSKASQRVARAVELGLMSWDRKRSKSGRNKRDGAVRDAVRNSVFAAGKALREASWAPTDFFSGVSRRRDPRRIFLRAILPI